MSSARSRRFAVSALIAAAALTLVGCTTTPDVESTGEVTEVTVTVQGMRYIPNVVEVPIGDELVVTFENTGTELHDIVFDNGRRSAHVRPGASEVIEVGVVSEDLDAWCSISNHRAMGMELTVRAVGQ